MNILKHNNINQQKVRLKKKIKLVSIFLFTIWLKHNINSFYFTFLHFYIFLIYIPFFSNSNYFTWHKGIFSGLTQIMALIYVGIFGLRSKKICLNNGSLLTNHIQDEMGQTWQKKNNLELNTGPNIDLGYHKTNEYKYCLLGCGFLLF